MMDFRVGLGEDIHVWVENRPLILAGVHVPYEKGLLGHSDADVVYHAIADSLLGALALGDIGKYFPVDDPKWDSADSSLILAKTNQMIKEKGYHVNNVDVTLSCEKPHLSKYSLAMRENIAKTLGVDLERVGLQLMTNEGMDAVGEGKAIRANCVALLIKE